MAAAEHYHIKPERLTELERVHTADVPPPQRQQPLFGDGSGWFKAMSGVIVAGIVAGIVAWTTVNQHERRLTASESTQSVLIVEQGKLRTKVESFEKWLDKIEGKLDRVITPPKKDRR